MLPLCEKRQSHLPQFDERQPSRWQKTEARPSTRILSAVSHVGQTKACGGDDIMTP